MDEVSYYEPMTLEQIEEVSSQIGEYVQPQNQTKSRKYGLVCYATDNREGADTEAKKMKDSLEVPQFHCALTGGKASSMAAVLIPSFILMGLTLSDKPIISFNNHYDQFECVDAALPYVRHV